MKGPPSKPNSPIISVDTTDEDIAQRVSELFGCSYHKVKNRNPEKWKDSYALRIQGKRAIGWMNKLYPHMSLRRRCQIERALASSTLSHPN